MYLWLSYQRESWGATHRRSENKLCFQVPRLRPAFVLSQLFNAFSKKLPAIFLDCQLVFSLQMRSKEVPLREFLCHRSSSRKLRKIFRLSWLRTSCNFSDHFIKICFNLVHFLVNFIECFVKQWDLQNCMIFFYEVSPEAIFYRSLIFKTSPITDLGLLIELLTSENIFLRPQSTLREICTIISSIYLLQKWQLGFTLKIIR